MSKGTYPCFSAEIPRAKLKDVQKDWKKYISAGSKAKVLEANDEISIAGAINKNISSDPFNVYSRLLETTVRFAESTTSPTGRLATMSWY